MVGAQRASLSWIQRRNPKSLKLECDALYRRPEWSQVGKGQVSDQNIVVIDDLDYCLCAGLPNSSTPQLAPTTNILIDSQHATAIVLELRQNEAVAKAQEESDICSVGQEKTQPRDQVFRGCQCGHVTFTIPCVPAVATVRQQHCLLLHSELRRKQQGCADCRGQGTDRHPGHSQHGSFDRFRWSKQPAHLPAQSQL